MKKMFGDAHIAKGFLQYPAAELDTLVRYLDAFIKTPEATSQRNRARMGKEFAQGKLGQDDRETVETQLRWKAERLRLSKESVFLLLSASTPHTPSLPPHPVVTVTSIIWF